MNKRKAREAVTVCFSVVQLPQFLPISSKGIWS